MSEQLETTNPLDPFDTLNTGNSLFFTLAVILSLPVFHAWVYGPQAALIAERFGTRSRYSGASLGYQLAAPFAGGLAPIIALLLWQGKTSLTALGLSRPWPTMPGTSCTH